MNKIKGYAFNKEISKTETEHIYEAIEITTNKKVTISRFSLVNLTSSEKTILENRCDFFAQIHEENILKIFNVIKKPDFLTVITENLPLNNLVESIQTKTIELKDVIKVAIQFTEILKELHNKGIILKQLAPKKFSIDPNNKIKLINLELSNNTDSEVSNNYSPEIIKDYLAYISPEQTGRINQSVNYSSNHYSLGIIFFELLTGSVPFTHEDPLELFHAHIAINPFIEEKSNNHTYNYMSKIILKLLSKNPNDRYLDLSSLQFDLEYILEASDNSERILNFIPGYKDTFGKFILPQKLFGRENELEIITESFNRINRGKTELILISGSAGIGKSSLVLEAHKKHINQSGTFFSGKFNISKKNEPYSAIIEIFSSLIKRTLIETSNSDDDDDNHINKFNQNISSNSKIITDIIPDAKFIFGKQPDTQQVGIEESHNRFKNIFETFFSIFQKIYSPIVFFIDDLQWADDASLYLLKILINSNLNSNIQFLLSYRDDSPETVKDIELWLSEIKNIKTISIKINPLTQEDLLTLFKETIQSDETNVINLSNTVFEKTAGNPFFISQFLELLSSDNHLKYDEVQKVWEWDIKEIKKINVTENVANIIIEKIKTLPADTLEILQFSTIIGNKFHLHTLSKTINKNPYKLFIILESLIKKTILSHHKEEYFFLHDKIYEAVYSTISEKTRAENHYKIGDFLINEIDENEIGSDLFTAVDHLNMGIDFILDNSLKEKLLYYNNIAGKKAMNSNANLSALNYFNHCLPLLPENPWNSNYNLTFSIFTKIAQCHYLNRDFVKAENYFKKILGNIRSDLDKAEIYSLQIILLTNQNKYSEALLLGIKALSLFKLNISESPSKLTIIKEFLKNKNLLKKIKINNITNFPGLDDPVKLAITDLLSNMLQPAYFSSKKNHTDLMILCILKLMNFSLKYGNTVYSAYAYVSYGGILCTKFSDYKNAYNIGKAGIILNEKNKNPQIYSKVHVIFSGMINFWIKSSEISLEHLTIAIKSGIENGDFLFMGNALTQYIYHSIRMGKNLNDIIYTYSIYKKILIDSKHDEAIDTIQSFYNMMLLLKGDTFKNNSYTSSSFDETEFENKIKNKTRLYYNFTLTKLKSLYLFDYFSNALKYGNKIYSDIEDVLLSVITTTEYYFYYFLTITAQFNSFNKKEQKLYYSRLKKIEKKFQRWSKFCSENFLQQYLLIKAELYKIDNKTSAAMDHFNLALTAAQKNSYKNHEAIIAECAGRFYLSNNNKVSATAFINIAIKKYRSWGAEGKAISTQEKYSSILSTNILTINDKSDKTDNLDIETILKVANTISSELHLDKLLKNLLKILFENAGAERCIVILPKKNNFFIEAEGYINDKETSMLKSIPIEDSLNIPLSIINYIIKTKEIIVLENAINDKLFSIDPYIKNNHILSLLCLPIIKQQEIMGIIYMDNSLMGGVFSHKKVELLKTLSSYIATSLENSILFNKTKNDEIKRLRQYEEVESQYEEMEALNEELQNTQIKLTKTNEDLTIFKMFADTSTQGIGMAYLNGEQTYINNAMCKMIGHEKPEDVYGISINDYHPPETVEQMEKVVIPTTLEKGEWTGESVLLSRLGKRIPIIQNLFLIRDSLNNPVQFATIMTDISDLKTVEKALKESESRFKMLVNNMNDGLAILDKELKISFVNPAFCEMVDFTCDELIDNDISILFDKKNRVSMVKQRELRKKGINSPYVIEAIKKNKTKITMSASPSSLYDNEGNFNGSFAVFTDITKKKRNEENLLKVSKLESLGIFAGGIAHDFNNILTGITGNLSIARLNISKDDPNYDIIYDAEKASGKAKELTQQLLTFSKGGEPIKKIISIEDILKETTNFVMSGSSINCDFNISQDLWDVDADSGQISQVIQNILINARQSMEYGGTILIEAKNHSNLQIDNFNQKNENFIEIIISDQGHGIADEIINSIFDPYFTTKNKGSGLGLAVSYSILKKHNGHIEVFSKIDKGTTFTIYLPASKKKATSKKTFYNSTPLTKAKILLMDDDDIILNVLNKMLTLLGHSVEISYHGEETLEKYNNSLNQKKPFDLIIMDLTIPGKMGGKKTIVKLLEINPEIKAIVSSGYSNDPIMANYKDYGFSAILSKPFNIEEIKSVLEKVLL